MVDILKLATEAWQQACRFFEIVRTFDKLINVWRTAFQQVRLLCHPFTDNVVAMFEHGRHESLQLQELLFRLASDCLTQFSRINTQQTEISTKRYLFFELIFEYQERTNRVVVCVTNISQLLALKNVKVDLLQLPVALQQ